MRGVRDGESESACRLSVPVHLCVGNTISRTKAAAAGEKSVKRLWTCALKLNDFNSN